MVRQLRIQDVLKGLSQEELIAIVAEAAERDGAFKNSLLLKYGKGDHSGKIQSCKKLIKSIVKKYTGREGFIPYRETNGFAMEMLALLEDKVGTQNDPLTLEIALLVLEEGVEAFQYADDSNGDIGMVVEEVLDRIGEMASSQEASDPAIRKQYFTRLLTMSKSNVFEGWEDFRISLLEICTEFADVKELREQLITTIGELIASNTNKEYREYSTEALLEILFMLVQEYGSEEEAAQFMEEHLHFTFFRETAIEKSMQTGDYRLAIELAEQGEQQDRKLPGLVSKWKEARYAAYKQLSLKQEQRQLAKELLLDGEYVYYQELESLFEGDQEVFYQGILKELRGEENWRSRAVYLQLISEKNDLGEILAYVKANPATIEEYAPRLSADYQAEVEQIYSQYIYIAAAAASDRKQYKKVCAILKRYKKVAGQASQSEIIQQLAEQYNKRPAFLDELAKI
ncbi:hypothetical protein [Paenibacillus ihuae]|uniref:hypothetical protein n=1 Tax=Paenibacillus ihuae TaxID=1232431 RepID=UPI0006D56A69|nr:hypothetical protein [Paenibacillus ihuae]